MAMLDSAPALEPVVLAAVENKINDHTLMFQVGPLLHKSIEFDTYVQNKLPLTEPARTTADYWVAQCLVRGLDTSGNETDLQERIRAYRNVCMMRIFEAEQAKLNIDFSVKDAAERIKPRHAKSRTAERRATVNLLRFIQERFPTRQSANCHSGPHPGVKAEAILLKISTGTKLRQAVEKSPGIFSKPVVALTAPYHIRWTVIGNDKGAVWKLVAEMARQEEEMDREREVAEHERYQIRHQNVIKKLSSSSNPSPSNRWSVAGKWEMSEAEDGVSYNWTPDNHIGYLKLHEAEFEDGTIPLWAKFEFENVRWVIRFVNPTEPHKTIEIVEPDETADIEEQEQTAQMQNFREAEAAQDDEEDNEDADDGDRDEEDGEDDDEEEEEDDDIYHYEDIDHEPSISEPEFAIAAKYGPSPSQATLSYRWRGEETEQDKIQYDCDENVYTVTSAGPRGTNLTGTFGGGQFSPISMTGFKTANEGITNPDYETFRQRDCRREGGDESLRQRRWY